MDEHLQRALELAERGRGTSHPNPVVGAVVVQRRRRCRGGLARARGRAARGGGSARGRRRARSRLDALRDDGAVRAPRAHPPCVDAVLAAGVGRVVAGCLDPAEDSGGGLERLRAAGLEVELVDAFEARAQNEAWRTWVDARPTVRHLQGRGDARRPRDRAGIALGVRRGEPPAGARAARARRTRSPSAWARCAPTIPASTHVASMPRASRGGSRSGAARCRTARELELRAGPLDGGTDGARPPKACSRCCSRADRRSPPHFSSRASSTSSSSSSRRGLRRRPVVLGELPQPVQLSRIDVQRVGDDVLVSAYVREPCTLDAVALG